MAQPMVNRAGIDGAIAMWSVRGYFIDDGSCQWATEDQNVVCIVATEKTVICALHDKFMAAIGTQLGYERHRCYLAAEVERPLLGWILKSENTDPNDVTPFFTKWGVSGGFPSSGARRPGSTDSHSLHGDCTGSTSS